MKERVLVIAPHPDDEVIGCGGTLLQHIQCEDRVFIFYATSGELFDTVENYNDKCNIRNSEIDKMASIASFDIILQSEIPAREIREKYTVITKRLEKVLRKIKPTIIYLPHENETDFDHKLVHQITKEAYFLSKLHKNTCTNSVKATLLGYEVWTPMQAMYRLNNIELYADKKKQLINAYNSQIKDLDYADGMLGLNQYRGTFFGNCKYAEAFSNILI